MEGVALEEGGEEGEEEGGEEEEGNDSDDRGSDDDEEDQWADIKSCERIFGNAVVAAPSYEFLVQSGSNQTK